MIQILKGNLFNSDCEAWVNTVNVVGIMSKGIAKEFKARFPKMFEDYRKLCSENKIQIGKMNVWPNPEGKPKWIINFPTKKDWRNPSKIEWIIQGLMDLNSVIIENQIKSIAIPALGCTNGALLWSNVRKLIETFHETLPSDVRVESYEPASR